MISLESEGFSYNLSASTLRQPNLRFSFSKGSERPKPETMTRVGKHDLVYDLGSTLNKTGTSFCNKTEDRLPKTSIKKIAGFNAPPPTTYNIKRMFESGCEGIPDQLRSPDRCTFGISHEHYRNVVIGSTKFLGLNRYSYGGAKMRVVCENAKLKTPGAIYQIPSSLKQRNYNIKSSALPENFFTSKNSIN
jgi:hypothetical protein